MKKIILLGSVCLLASVPAHARVDIGINLGGPAYVAPTYVAPVEPVYVTPSYVETPVYPEYYRYRHHHHWHHYHR